MEIDFKGINLNILELNLHICHRAGYIFKINHNVGVEVAWQWQWNDNVLDYNFNGFQSDESAVYFSFPFL